MYEREDPEPNTSTGPRDETLENLSAATAAHSLVWVYCLYLHDIILANQEHVFGFREV